ncbi:hypothetical protein SAMN05421858_3825 [Haladaptatus litoreus]|uniref:Uncharacterized protein n=1 Tax=Haladaptatus litoreus TaxID=553468 RepID=A0A1N7DX62_9EURY|nr:hypothetical protein [Haladaptatus litoreus]SIR80423.1 hypothetical protein SAMN05421858_3825 [Haladaptatus litoreus]
MAREQRNDRLPERMRTPVRTNDDNPGLNDANRGVSDNYRDKR